MKLETESLTPLIHNVRLKLVAFWAPIKQRLFFIFVMVMLAALAFTVYTTATLFAYDDQEYRTQKENEIVNIGLNKDAVVVDKVLQLQTANSGPIRPNYVPGRDNPFAE